MAVGAKAGTAYVDVQGDFSGLNRGLALQAGRLNKDFNKLGGQLGRALTRGALVATKGAALATAGGLAFAVKRAADFESQLSSLGAVTDATNKQLALMEKQALKAGAATKFSALEAAQAQTELAKGGLRLSQIMKGGLTAALALAAAGELELADAARTTVNAIKLFGLRGKEAMRVADGLATAANQTTADVSDFALALQQGGSAAKAAGLDFTETVAVLEALAEVGVKGSDAGTSMKAALTQLARPTAKASALTKQLGLDFFDAEGNMKNLPALAGMLREKLGGLTREQRLNAVTTLVGTDGMRALLALYDAGPQKIARFEKGLSKQGTAAEVARRKQDNLKGSLEQLSGSAETLAITVGQLMIPSIRKGAEELTDFTNKLSRIVGRKDLDVGEKLSRSFNLAKVEAGPWVDKLGKALEDADLPEKVGKAVSAATPVILESMAKAGPAAAKAFIETFLAADAWGKLAIGALVAKRLGGGLPGRGGLGGRAAGGLLSSAKPIPVFVVNQGGLPGGGGKGGIVGTLSKAGKFTGVARLALGGATVALPVGILVAGLSQNKDLQTGGGASTRRSAANRPGLVAPSQAFERVPDGGRSPIKDESAAAAAAGAEQLARRVRVLRGEISQMTEKSGGDLRGLSRSAARNFREIRDSIGSNTREGRKLALQNFKEVARGIAEAMRDGKVSTDQATGAIKKLLGDRTREGKRALKGNMDEIIGVISRTMRRGGKITNDGLALIRAAYVKELQMFGLSPKQALNEARPGGRFDGGPDEGSRGIGKQRGGWIRGGKPSGDTVPAMLERGEYVLNRKAVATFGQRALDQINFGTAPRFAKGGIVALGRKLQREGYAVGEHPAFGGVAPVHTANSYHYRGMALDVNADSFPGGEMPALDRLYARLKRLPGVVELLWRVADHFDHLHVAMGPGGGSLGSAVPKLKRILVDGADSPLKSVIQGTLDKARSAGNKKLRRMAGSVEGTEGSFSGFSGPWTEVMAKIARSKGWSLPDWKELVRRESGGNPEAVNPSSGAFGIGQFLGSTLEAYAKYGAKSHDPVKQIQAMARYIADRYTNPSAALRFHDANNYYRKGGPVGYAGDSLGVGTAPRLKGLLDRKIFQDTVSGRSSAAGLAAMRKMKGAAQYVFDLGTNDGDVGQTRASLKAAGRFAWNHGKSPLHFLTTLGPDAARKNKMFRASPGGNEHLVDWAKVAGKYVGSDPMGIHPNAAGYAKRAQMLAASIKGADTKGKDAAAPLPNGLLARAIAKVKRGKTPKIRSKAIRALEKRIGNVGDLPDKLKKRIAKLTKDSEIFGELAGRAGSITLEGGDGTSTLGVVNGLNESQWLEKQLGTLFQLRNAIIRAEEMVVERREQIAQMLERATRRFHELDKLVGQTAKDPNGWKGISPATGSVAKWNKLPDTQKLALMRKFRKAGGKLPWGRAFEEDGSLVTEKSHPARFKPLAREHAALKDILPNLKTRRSKLNTSRGDLLTALSDVQGIGSPMGRMKTLPPLGVLGGSILDTQLRLRDLGIKPTATDTSGDDKLARLEEELRLANLRTAVSERHFEVLRNFPPFGGQFATGGVVPGPAGAPRTIIAHGGETVIPNDGGMGGVHLHFAPGTEWLKDFVDVRVDQRTRRDSRSASRALPGRGF